MVSVEDLKLAAAAIGANWRSSAVSMGVLDGASGRRRLAEKYRPTSLKGWSEEYDAAFDYGEGMAGRLL